jgi:hypothetical protein
MGWVEKTQTIDGVGAEFALELGPGCLGVIAGRPLADEALAC